MTLKTDQILPRMWDSLWKLANGQGDTRGKMGSQKRALKLLLEIRGGVEFVISRRPEELEELERRGICSSPAILQDLALLEIQRRRLMLDLAAIEAHSRQILRDLGLTRIASSTADQRKVPSRTQ
jgi:hypothetical protein